MSRSMLYLCVASMCAFSASAQAAQAPVFDTSGNGMLSGTYYFRHVIYGINTSADSQGVAGDVSEAIATYGNISFDGNGNYTMNPGVMVSDSQVGTPDPLSCYQAQATCKAGAGTAVTGTYSVSASGLGFLSNPIVSGDSIYFMVAANGVAAGSSTETNYTYADMFVAVPLSSTQPTNATFQGSYSVAAYLPGGSPLSSEDAFFQINADGNGNLGTVNVTGYSGGGGTATVSQSSSNVKYFFSNGAAVVTFPTSTTAAFFSGQEYFYFSPDGSFFVGGSPTSGYDMVIGVRNSSGTPNFAGSYYETGLDQNLSTVTSSGYADFDGYYGSINVESNGNILAHDRLNDLFSGTIGSTYADSLPTPLTGTYNDTASSFQYAIGSNGAIRIGAGTWPYLGITLAVQGPTFTPPTNQSVYISPTGIVNAASFSPFTAGVSGGEFLAIFGNNLASGTVVAKTVPYPTTLGGVQVLVGGLPVPLYFVSPTQIAAIMPAAFPYALANFQVSNNGATSNVVTMPVNATTPGVYTIPSGGIGYAAAVHANGQIVNASNPAQPGETIEVFTTGLGKVYPPVADGAAPPYSPLSPTVNTVDAYVGGTSAVGQYYFAGLAPGLAGLYQINAQIPSLASGNYTLDVAGPDSYAAQAIVPVGVAVNSLSGAPTVASARVRKSPARISPAAAKRTRPCFFGTKESCAAASLSGTASSLK